MWQSVVIGLFATAVTDGWQLLLKSLAGLPPANWRLIGRWVCYFPSGKITHAPIGAAAAKRYEAKVGWFFHYLVGVVFAALYLAALRYGLRVEPTWANGLVFGVVTAAAPFLFMQPAMGMGLFASRAPAPNRIRLVTISSHIVFGLALWLGWLLLDHVD
ncbi:MAG: DUF2938 family protein [Pseudolabrys sp.]|jgi:hypothetical protein